MIQHPIKPIRLNLKSIILIEHQEGIGNDIKMIVFLDKMDLKYYLENPD